VLQDKTIGFLGAGAITEALIRGLLDGGVVRPEQMVVSNRANRERLASLAARFGVRTGTKAGVVNCADVLVLACKPKDVVDLLDEVGGSTREGQVLLSVLAGVGTDLIASLVKPGVQIVRAMPNTSSQVGESATAICPGAGAGPEALELCGRVLGAVGRVVAVPEHMLDAVTGLSGSGPAYIYLLVEAMMEAGKGVGLPGQVARELAIQTIKGAAKMLEESGEDPAVLRQKVTSPNGTTQAGLQVLHEAGFVPAVVKCVARATQRSRELGGLSRAPRTAAQ
jgi:pyrroline-5-carboxylate reductase